MGRPAHKRVFGEIERLPSRRFRARYTGPDYRRHSAPITFVTKMDAEAWLVAEDRAISRGEWKPPAQTTQEPLELFGDYAIRVVGRRHLRPGTQALYEKLLRLAILPTFKARPITSITPSDVANWYSTMADTPTQQANAYGLLKSILKDAFDEESLTGVLRPSDQVEDLLEGETLMHDGELELSLAGYGFQWLWVRPSVRPRCTTALAD